MSARRLRRISYGPINNDTVNPDQGAIQGVHVGDICRRRVRGGWQTGVAVRSKNGQIRCRYVRELTGDEAATALRRRKGKGAAAGN